MQPQPRSRRYSNPAAAFSVSFSPVWQVLDFHRKCGILGAGLSPWVQPVPSRVVFANILHVSKGSRLTRRRLHSTVRKTILSYYSEEEAAKIAKAAKKQKVTISNFVASAALREADVVNSKPDKRQ